MHPSFQHHALVQGYVHVHVHSHYHVHFHDLSMSMNCKYDGIHVYVYVRVPVMSMHMHRSRDMFMFMFMDLNMDTDTGIDIAAHNFFIWKNAGPCGIRSVLYRNEKKLTMSEPVTSVPNKAAPVGIFFSVGIGLTRKCQVCQCQPWFSAQLW